MKTTLMLVAATALSLVLPGLVLGFQEAEPNVPANEQVYIPFRWNQGDSRKFRITESKSQRKGETTKQGNGSVRDIELEVVEKSEKGLVVSWRLGIESAKGVAPADPVSKEIMKIYSGLKIRVQIDGEGVYQGVQNWEEIDAANQKLKAILKQVVQDIDLPREQKQAVWNATMKRYGSRQAIEAKMTEPLQLLVTMTNCEFAKKGIEEYETQVPYLGKTLPASERYSVASLDAKNQLVKIDWAREIDQEKSQPLIEQAMAELAKELGKENPQPESLKGYLVSSTGQYEIDLKTGWPVKIVLEHTAGPESSLSIRTLTIESRK